MTTEWNITSICQWNTTYSVNPQDLECVLQFCNNATLHVNELYNYDFQWSEDDRVKLGKNIVYPCKGSMRIENSSRHKLEADQEIVVKCGEDGNFQYPEQWPQCLDDVSCGNPPIVPNFGYQVCIIYCSKQDWCFPEELECQCTHSLKIQVKHYFRWFAYTNILILIYYLEN